MVLFQVLLLGLALSCLYLIAKYSAKSEDHFNRTPKEFFREAALGITALVFQWVTEQPLLCLLVGLFLFGAECDPVARVILYTLQFTVLAALCMPAICSMINDAIQRSEGQWATVSKVSEKSEDLQKYQIDSSPEVTGDLKLIGVSSERASGYGAFQKLESSTHLSGSLVLSPPSAISQTLNTLSCPLIY